MNKKLMVLAVAGALAAPAAAFAQASNVQIWGRINTGLDNYSAGGSTAGSATDYRSRYRVYDSASRLGVRGTEDLGNGLKAVFSIESGLNIDSGTVNGQSAAANVSSGVLASRDSFAGLEGNWGRLTFGRQSFFWSGAGVNDMIAAIYINSGVPWSNNANFARIAGPAARQSNDIKYQSPTWSGFNVMLNYAPNSEAVGTNAAGVGNLIASAAGVNPSDARVWGITAGYTTGPFDMHLDYAGNLNASGAANGFRQNVTGLKADFGWAYQPGARLSIIWGRNKSDQSSGITSGIGFTAGDNLAQSQWTVNWDHTFGNIHAMAQYGRLGNVSGCSAASGTAAGCDQTGARAWTLAARYNFSKRTSMYVSYMQTNNDAKQWNDYAAGGISSAAATGLPAASAGADPRLWAVGISHWF